MTEGRKVRRKVKRARRTPLRSSVETSDLTDATKAAWLALREANDEADVRAFYFRYGDQVCRFEHTDDGRPVPRPLDRDGMRYRLSEIATWYRESNNTNHVGAPREVVANVLATPDPPLPVVSRVVEVPTLIADGSIHDQPGYSRRGRLFYVPAPGAFVPQVKARPSKATRARALSLIADDLLGDFPFTGDAERAHAICLVLQPFVRDLIAGPTPLYLIEAPTPGTGKGLLAQVAAWPALGKAAPPMVEGGDEDEWRKRITSTLAESPPAVLIDNVQDRLDSAALAALLTSTQWTDRWLGKTRNVTLPNRAAWIVTANNPTLSGEITRRCVRIRLDAKDEHPEDRTDFRHPDLPDWTAQHRGELVWAALTLARAWVSAGRPAGAECLGSFEAWSTVMGGILAHAGVPNFLDNTDELRDRAGSERDEMKEVLSEWYRCHKGRPIKARDLPPDVVEAFGFDPYRPGISTALGHRLREHVDRRYGNYTLRRAGRRDGVARWRVEKAR